MPNRIIKESIHTSERLNTLSDFQFRLWVSLITYVDDYGRGDARAAVIRGTCFPLRERLTNKDIDAALNALAGAGCVGLYTVDGKPYLYFPNWTSHQTVRNRKSKFPDPDNCMQLHADVPVIQSNPNPNPNPIQSEGERTRETRFTPPTVEEVTAYCRERGNSVDAERFVNFYASKGWKVGSEPMKDWKACVRTWERRDDHHGGRGAPNSATSTADRLAQMIQEGVFDD